MAAALVCGREACHHGRMRSRYGCSEEPLCRHVCRRTTPVRVDGDLGKECHNGLSPAHSPGWALDMHGVYDSHMPECFSCVELPA